MDQESIAEIRAQTVRLYHRGVKWLARVPVTAQVVAGLFLLSALLMGIHTAIGVHDATLRLKVQHSFRSAQLQVWVDNDRLYSGKLVGSSKKRFGLFSDPVQGSLSETLQVPSGSHRVKIRVSGEDGTIQEDTIDADFSRNAQRTLAVVARRSAVSLSWQGSVASATDPPPAASGWLAPYASTLILTAAGSIISALTGFALRELPGYFRGRRTSGSPTPKAQKLGA
jgi:hypothetical protein